MIKDNYTRKLIILIIVTLFILSSLYIIDNASASVDDNVKNVKTITKKKVPIIAMKAKPSCYSCYKNRVKYRWYRTRFVNYCPHCNKYNTLLKNPKRVYEREYTCKRCGADYCAFCGRDKHSNKRIHRKYKLMKAK